MSTIIPTKVCMGLWFAKCIMFIIQICNGIMGNALRTNSEERMRLRGSQRKRERAIIGLKKPEDRRL